MNQPMETGRPVAGDVELGVLDAGLAESVVVSSKTESVAKPRARDEADTDPQSEVNCYGVAVMEIDRQ